MSKAFRITFLVFVFLAVSGCSQEQTPTSSQSQAQSESAAPADASPLLVFFLDPNGGPCRQQDSILTRMQDQLEGKVQIRPVQTTVPEDRELFYAYGVRALPTLLLADGNGREIDRLPPGVQSSARIQKLLQQLPGE